LSNCRLFSGIAKTISTTQVTGLRKLRFEEPLRGKGKRGGLRVIYYWWSGKDQFWMFTLYSKGEMKDLTARELSVLKIMLANELRARRVLL
jgi:hypothetical protein